MGVPNNRLVLLGLALAIGTLLAAGSAHAASKTPNVCPICHRANDQSLPYPEKAGATLVRGATNLVFGWTELLVQPANEAQGDGNLMMGIGKGIGQSVTRTASGLGELLTFWVPKGKAGYLSLTTTCPICLSTIAKPSPPNETPAPSAPSTSKSH